MSVRAWQDTISIETYPLGPEDPNPPLQRQGGSWACYPYPMQDDVLEGPPAPREYTALHIENEYLHCIVLPELGGRVYSLYDKVCEREVFYRNNVIKYGLVGIRGAWISGGIEFNFPTGHTYTTVSPVSWEMGEGEDENEAWIVIGNICRVTGMQWGVRLSLRPAQRCLREEVHLSNPMPFKQRYWFWNNSAVPATDDLHLIYPARKARVAGGIVDYPVTADGTDISWYRNHPRADDIFTLDVKEDFFGIHYTDSDFGMVHVADRRDLLGKKFFTWGTADDGMIWEGLLTDDDGQYVEIQSGRFETQYIWEFLQPYDSVGWDGYWLPEHGMDRWVWANQFGVLNFEIANGKLNLGALTAQPYEAAVLSLEADGRPLWSRELMIGPDEPFRTELDVPEGCGEGTPFTLTLSEATGGEIIRYEHPPRHTTRPKVAETGEDISPPAKPEDECTAEELCVRATDALRRLEHAAARRLYEKALERDDGFCGARVGLGMLDYRSGRYESARRHLEIAVARDRESYAAWHYLGLARWRAGDVEAAQDAAEEAYRRGLEFSACSLMSELAGEEAPAPPPDEPQDLPRTVSSFLEDALYVPTTLRGQPASGAASDTIQRFAHWTRGDVELWLEQAFTWSEGYAIRTVQLALDHCPAAADYPMTHYCLAHWHRQLGREHDAAQAYARAARCPVDYCFPSRLDELPVLQGAIEHDPSDWKAKYLLGNLLASLDRTEEAMAQWRRAVALDDSFAVLHRNLGLGALRWEGDAQQAVEHYHRAIERNPNDYRYYLDLLPIYADLKRGDRERLALLQSAPPEIQSKWQIAAQIAEVLVALKRFDDALVVLQAHQFYPWEGARHMRSVWIGCLLGRAEAATEAGDHAQALADIELAATYPRNLGVGKSATPNDARIHWLAAEQARELGDEAKRREHLTSAADEPHRGMSDADWWKLLALRELRREAEAGELETALREWAQRHSADARHGESARVMLERLGD